MFIPQHTCRSQRKTCERLLSHSTMWLLALNSGVQTWQQPSFLEPFCRPAYLSDLLSFIARSLSLSLSLPLSPSVEDWILVLGHACNKRAFLPLNHTPQTTFYIHTLSFCLIRFSFPIFMPFHSYAHNFASSTWNNFQSISYPLLKT